mgnify:CR=1 FL=1
MIKSAAFKKVVDFLYVRYEHCLTDVSPEATLIVKTIAKGGAILPEIVRYIWLLPLSVGCSLSFGKQ